MQQPTNEVATVSPNHGVPTAFNHFKDLVEFRSTLQNFNKAANAEPPEKSIGKTPDQKAKTVYISHIEMSLDELFFGLWSTENFKWQQIGNEIVGTIDLIVIHPGTGFPLRRSGAAAITIMVDAVPDDMKSPPEEYNLNRDEYYKKAKLRNTWALDMQNKKPSALDMGFPKLKAECLKNAAQSLGKLFGRDLNRDIKDQYDPLQKKEVIDIPEDVVNIIGLMEDEIDILTFYRAHPEYHSNPDFLPLLNNRKAAIKANK